MARGNGLAHLDAWIERSWPDGAPPWTRDAFADLYREEQRQAAAERRERLEVQRIKRLEQDNQELRRRLAVLEQLLGPGGRTLGKTITGAVADSLPQVIDRHLECRRTMVDRGIWSAEETYRPGHCVTHAGAHWVATDPASPGQRPGKGAPWRLAAKGETRPAVR